MILSKKLILAALLIESLNATSLKSIINSTLQNNENLKVLQSQDLSKKEIYNGVSNTYKPTLNIGANMLRLDQDTREVQVGTTSTAFIKLGINLYDGGKSSSIKKQKSYEYQISKLNTTTTTKQLLLQSVTLFFNAKTIMENIKVFENKSITLKAQYERVKTKYDLKMTTIDEVLKLKSEYETNQYTIQDLEYKKEELLQNLSVITGKNITSLDNTTLPSAFGIRYNQSENIKSLKLGIQVEEQNFNSLDSVNKPQIKLENSYVFYNYADYNQKLLSDLPEQQNQLMLTLSYNLFDSSSSSKIKASKLAKNALNEKLNYAVKEEKTKFNLAGKKLSIQKLKIQSLKSAIEMANSIYDIVKTKYKNGIVDNIVYLDALDKKTYNQALYLQALNDYEIFKAEYYFASGMDYKKVIDRF